MGARGRRRVRRLRCLSLVLIGNLIRLLPTFKQILIDATLVALLLLETTGLADGAVFALIAGMVAAVAVNVVRFLLATVVGLSGMLGGMGPNGVAPDGGMGVSGRVGIAALGAVLNFVGMILFSPVGYLVGGAAGAFLNGNL